MAVTLTIKQVPEALAAALKERAAANKRSLQKELLVIMEHAAEPGAAPVPMSWQTIAEPAHPRYAENARDAQGNKRTGRPASGKLTLDQLWQRARKLGAAMPDESVDIVRKDRDAPDH